MSGLPVRSGTLAARLWWATLPYYGWTAGSPGQRVEDVFDGARPAPWWAYPLGWLHQLAERLPRCYPVFEPMPPIECDCVDCCDLDGVTS